MKVVCAIDCDEEMCGRNDQPALERDTFTVIDSKFDYGKRWFMFTERPDCWYEAFAFIPVEYTYLLDEDS